MFVTPVLENHRNDWFDIYEESDWLCFAPWTFHHGVDLLWISCTTWSRVISGNSARCNRRTATPVLANLRNNRWEMFAGSKLLRFVPWTSKHGGVVRWSRAQFGPEVYQTLLPYMIWCLRHQSFRAPATSGATCLTNRTYRHLHWGRSTMVVLSGHGRRNLGISCISYNYLR